MRWSPIGWQRGCREQDAILNPIADGFVAKARALGRWAGRLMPQLCLLCTAPSFDDPVCAPCAAELPRLAAGCLVCGIPGPSPRCGACLASPPWFDRTHAAWPYAYPLDRLVQAYKFHARLQLAPWFGRALAPAVAAGSLIVAVPLHPERLRERGFNQAEELARHIARICGARTLTRGIRRVRATAEQSRTRHAARAENVRNVFACDLDLAGNAVVVIDDVMTTGATLDEFAATLKRAGAATVANCVIARTLL